jgi:hypothetical protein
MRRYLGFIQAVTAMTSAMLAALCSTLPGWSQTVDIKKTPAFQLHVQRSYEMPADTGWNVLKASPKIDPKIIDAIGEVRSALPAWSGLHHMSPAKINN